MCLRADSFEEAKRNYFAMALRAVVLSLGNKFPAYGDYIKGITEPVKRETTESASEIRDRFMQMFKGG